MKRLAMLFVGSLVAAVFAAPAGASLPGDPGISSSHPFRLNDMTLEPGCFVPGRGPVDLDSHLDLTYLSQGALATELHVSVDQDSPVNVDQVLVPSAFDGYNVYNTFSNTNRPDDIGPNQTAVDMFAPDSNGIDGPDPISQDDVIVCASDHGIAQNEPYQQEAGGLVSAKNRPIIQPQVTALGVSALEDLNTYKIGFGYSADQWYSVPSYDGANTPLTVTDPNAIPSPTFLGTLPGAVVLRQRPADFPYDAKRVNDVDKAGESWTHGNPDDGQDVVFKATGDSTAWTDSNGNGLLTTLTEGDLPISWTLRSSLAAPSSERSVSFSFDQLAAWNADWQAWYAGTGPKPTLPLAPGTNSPKPLAVLIVNPPETAPAAPSGATSITVVQQVPVQPSSNRCVSNRKIHLRFSKKVQSLKIHFGSKTINTRGHKVTLDFTGMSANHSAQMAVVSITERVRHGKHTRIRHISKLYKLC